MHHCIFCVVDILVFILFPRCRQGKIASALAAALQDEFGESDVQVEMLKDTGLTGNFEVILQNNGEVFHSAANGDGRVDTAVGTQAIVDKLKAWFDQV